MALRLTFIATSLAIAAPAFSQTSSTQAILEEVVVTAQRRTESLQDAAIAVDAASWDRLVRSGITDARGLNKISPALNVVSAGGSYNVYFVRGVGNFAANAYTDPALAYNVDGVYIGRPSATSVSFLDLERVEVLKGPQGTLYGRNATAGAINLIPAKPEAGQTYGYVSAGIGNFGSIEASGAFNLSIGDNWALRVAAGLVENDGYNDDGTMQTDDLGFRGQVYGSLSDTIDLRVSLDYATSNGKGDAPTYLGTYGFQFAGPSDNANNLPTYNFNDAPDDVAAAYTGPLGTSARSYYASLNTTPAFTSTAPQLVPGLDNTYAGITAELNFNWDFGNLTLIPAYRDTDIDVIFNTPGFQAAFNDENHEQFSLEARLATTTGAIDWIFGAFYFNEDVDALLAFNQQSLQSTQTIEASDSESKALFAHGTFNLTDKARLVAALRWTDDKKTFKGVANVFLDLCIREQEVFPGGPVIPNCDGAPVVPAGLTVDDVLAQINPADLPAGPPGIGTGPVPYGQVPLFPGPGAPPANLLFINPLAVNREQTNDELTYRVALEYDIADESLLWASYETGYRSGGFSLALGREEYLPEYLDAFTIGSKNRFFEGQLQLNAELFYWDYKDQQATHLGADINGNSAFFTENVGKSSISGLELDFQYAATNSTVLRGNFQYLDNEIDEFSYTQLTPDPEVRVVTGCSQTLDEVIPSGALWIVDCAGMQGRNSPEFSFGLGLDQGFRVGALDGLVTIDGRYRDERWVGFDFTPPQREDSMTVFSATAQLGSGDGTWSVIAYVRNITDEEVGAITQVLGSVDNVVSTVYEPPRTYGIRLNYSF